MLYIGTRWSYLCINKNEKDMNATDTMTRLSAMFSSDESFAAMVELVDDLGLELRDVVMA